MRLTLKVTREHLKVMVAEDLVREVRTSTGKCYTVGSYRLKELT